MVSSWSDNNLVSISLIKKFCSWCKVTRGSAFNLILFGAQQELNNWKIKSINAGLFVLSTNCEGEPNNFPRLSNVPLVTKSKVSMIFFASRSVELLVSLSLAMNCFARVRDSFIFFAFGCNFSISWVIAAVSCFAGFLSARQLGCPNQFLLAVSSCLIACSLRVGYNFSCWIFNCVMKSLWFLFVKIRAL